MTILANECVRSVIYETVCLEYAQGLGSSICAGLLVQQFVRWLRNHPVERDLALKLLASEMNPL
jgi:hypothetical protein